MSFFEEKLHQLVEALGKAGVRGHEEVKERKRVFEKSGGAFETVPHELEGEIEEPLSGDGFSSRRSPAWLNPDAGNHDASRWREVRLFLIDIADYSIERRGAENLEIWRKMDEWEFEGKLVLKNRSYLRLSRFSWDGAK